MPTESLAPTLCTESLPLPELAPPTTPEPPVPTATKPSPELAKLPPLEWHHDRQPSWVSSQQDGASACMPPTPPPAQVEPLSSPEKPSPAPTYSSKPSEEEKVTARESSVERQDSLQEEGEMDLQVQPPKAIAAGMAPEQAVEIPDIRDCSAQRPPANQPSLTSAAIDRRLRRVFTPKANGSFKVPAKFVEEWRKGSTARKSLEKILASVGYDTERVSHVALRLWAVCIYI